MIDFTCDCGKPLQAKEEYAGQRTRCPSCGHEMLIPAASTAIQPASLREPRRPQAPDEDVDDYGTTTGSRGMSTKAVVALVVGVGVLILCVVGAVPMLLIGLMIPAQQKVRAAAERMQSQNNLKQIVLACHNYHDAHGCFPPAVVYDAQGKPLYSWRVLILPYLEQQNLYQQFHLEEPWDSPHNKTLLSDMPRLYLDPARTSPESGTTTYLALTGKGALFESDPRNGLLPFKTNPKLFQAKPAIGLKDVTDGTSNTLLVAEAADAVPWTKPQDLEYAPDGPLPRFSTAQGGGFNAALADGAVRWLPSGVSERTLRALITRNGGEIIAPGELK